MPASMNNYIYHNMKNEITNPFPTSTVEALKFGNGNVV